MYTLSKQLYDKMYTNVYKSIQMFTWKLCNHWYESFLKSKKNIVFSKFDVTFFHLDSSGTAWQVNVLKHSEKTGDVGISLCSYLEISKSHFISTCIFFIFRNLFFSLFFLHECNEFLKLRSDFSHIFLAQTRYFFIVCKCALTFNLDLSTYSKCFIGV